MESRIKRRKVIKQPDDFNHIVDLIKNLGIKEYDPNVPHMLLEFSNAFTHEIIEDSIKYSEFMDKPGEVTMPGIEIAMKNYDGKYFKKHSNTEFMKELASSRNEKKIPIAC